MSRFYFADTGSTYALPFILNRILTILSLSLYYPWERAIQLKYIYNNIILDGSHFDFLGTGKDLWLYQTFGIDNPILWGLLGVNGPRFHFICYNVFIYFYGYWIYICDTIFYP